MAQPSTTASTTQAPRVRMPRAQREAQILRVAEEVFSVQGYQATTMEDVAERVGVTKPLIYEYFGSKEGLLAACMHRARVQLREATLEAWSALEETASVEEVFTVSIRAFFDFIDEHGPAFALMQHEGLLAAGASEGVESIRTEQASVVAKAFAAISGVEGVPAAVLEGYAEAVVGACERVAVWRTRHPEVTSEEAAGIVMATVWHGLSSRLPKVGPRPV